MYCFSRAFINRFSCFSWWKSLIVFLLVHMWLGKCYLFCFYVVKSNLWVTILACSTFYGSDLPYKSLICLHAHTFRASHAKGKANKSKICNPCLTNRRFVRHGKVCKYASLRHVKAMQVTPFTTCPWQRLVLTCLTPCHPEGKAWACIASRSLAILSCSMPKARCT